MKKQIRRTRIVSQLRSHAGFWLRLVSNDVSHAFAVKLLSRDVTVAEWVVLREMYGQAEMAPSMLAQRMGITRGAASKLIDRLVRKSLVARSARPGDGRRQEIILTAAGRKLVPVLAAIADRNDREFFKPLTRDERKLLIALLKKIAGAHDLRRLPIE